MGAVPRKLIAGVIVLLCVLVLSLCPSCSRGDQAAAAAGTGTNGPRSDWPPVIRIGFVPSEGGVDIVERFAPLVKHLSQELGHPIEARSATEYIGVITAMQNKQLEFAYFGPKAYIEARTMAGAEAVVRELDVNGNPGYRAILIVHKDSAFQSLADLRGTKFGFVVQNSTSGYLVPAVGIMEQTGAKPSAYFGQIVWTGTHGNAMQAVARRELDAAATNDLDLQAMHDAGSINQQDFRIVWTSDLIPGSPIAARSDVPESLKIAFREAVLSMNARPEELDAMSRGGFVAATDADYESVRLLQSIEADLRSGG